MRILLFFISSLLFAAGGEPTGKYKTIVDQIRMLERNNPDLVSVFSIGTNDDDIDIYAVRISSNPTQVDPGKIGQLIVSTHHGNETAAPVFTMAFINNLIERYRSGGLYRAPLSDMEWTIIPVLNIHGYNANNRYEHGVDPNRDYPGPCNERSTGKLKSIRLLMELLQKRTYTGSVTVHGYHGSLTYPWGMYAQNYQTLDHNAYHAIAEKAAEFNGYQTGTAADVVYPANGCYEDYVYWKHGSWSLLLELKNGNPRDIEETVPAIASFFDQLDRTPSLQNQFTTSCERYRGPDLRME